MSVRLPDLEAFGWTPGERLGLLLEDARKDLIDGMKVVDTEEERDLHVRVGRLVNELDGLREYMARRGGE
jgi:hypothetical protein